MTKPAHRAINHVEEVRVSQGTRAMSQPCTHEVRTFQQEWDDLSAQKKELEMQLQGYSKTMFLKEQHEIRKQKGNTLSAWIHRKAELEEKRRKIVEEKIAVELRMMSIKERVKQDAREKAQQDDRAKVRVPDRREELFEAMLVELRAIRSLLEHRGD